MNRKLRIRKGVTAVEFAIVFPLILAFLFSLIEIMHLYRVSDSLKMAAFKGGREASITTSTSDVVRAEIEDSLDKARVGASAIEISPSTFDADTAEVTIEISVPTTSENGFYLFGPLLNGSLDKSITIRRLN